MRTKAAKGFDQGCFPPNCLLCLWCAELAAGRPGQCRVLIPTGRHQKDQTHGPDFSFFLNPSSLHGQRSGPRLGAGIKEGCECTPLDPPLGPFLNTGLISKRKARQFHLEIVQTKYSNVPPSFSFSKFSRICKYFQSNNNNKKEAEFGRNPLLLKNILSGFGSGVHLCVLQWVLRDHGMSISKVGSLSLVEKWDVPRKAST